MSEVCHAKLTTAANAHQSATTLEPDRSVADGRDVFHLSITGHVLFFSSLGYSGLLVGPRQASSRATLPQTSHHHVVLMLWPMSISFTSLLHVSSLAELKLN